MKILHLISVLILMTTANFALGEGESKTSANRTALSNTKNEPKLLFIAGSVRKDSVNKKLAYNAYQIAKSLGANSTFIDLKDYPLPIYDGDLESAKGLPEKALELKKIFLEHNGIFIASPEYNSSITPLLKNTLDWVSRSSEKDEAPNKVYKNKIVALSSASPSDYGGQRSLIPLQSMLSNIGATVLSRKVSIPKAYDKFNKEGLLIDDKERQELRLLIEDLIRTINAMKNSDKEK